MLPEIHGLEHKDYASLTFMEIVLELRECKEWIFNKFGYEATKFYTPWGAGADARGSHIDRAAAFVDLEMVTCEKIIKLKGRYGVLQELKNGRDINYLDGNEVFLHWWESVGRLRRMIEVIKHGDWKSAKAKNKQLFRE